MIEKMKKYDFLIYHKDYQPFLLKLRELGVVHVMQKQTGAPPEGSELSAWLERERRYSNIIKSLQQINEKRAVTEVKPADKNIHGDPILEHTESLFEELDTLKLDRQGIQKEIDRISPLGDLEPGSIHRLDDHGWYIHFHTVAESKFDPQWEEEFNAVKLKENGSQIYFLTMTRSPNMPAIEAEHIRLSEKSVTGWNNDLKEINSRVQIIEDELAEIALNDIETLRYNEIRVKDHINFEKVELSGNTAAEEKLMVLEGYVPAENELETSKALEKESVYFTVEAPRPEDNPPIKFKNNRFARPFEMIGDLYDRPNYNAFDLTPFFAPFYVIFFGLCLGDCGYGLLIFIASFFIKKYGKSDFMQTAGQLATYLGLGTMIFGFISGTFFGIPLLDVNWAWIQPLKRLILDSDQLFTLALLMGVIQITYALTIKAITNWMRFGFVYSLDTFGWLITLWGNIIVYLLSSNGTINPAYQSTLHIIVSCIGGAMMLFFNNPKKGLRGIPGSIGSGLFGLYNKISGLLGDLLSYIRLFALGISGSVMGLVFNQLAIGMAPDIIIVKQLVMVLILVFGHSINIFINGLGAFIHPMRLTFVEFYNNAGFDGGGKAYNPFKKYAD